MNIRLRSVAMLAIFLLSMFAGSFAPTGKALAAGGTPVSGHITANTTWTAENGPYLIQGDILVESGATLTIGAGTQVLFTGNYYLKVDVSSHIAMNGTEGNLVSIGASNWRQGTLRLASGGNSIQYCVFRN